LFVPYSFEPEDRELEPQTSAARGGQPPRKSIGIGVLEPPGPPARPSGFLASLPAGLLLRVLAWLLLAGIAAGTLASYFRR
jgi:hypothetical protein